MCSCRLTEYRGADRRARWGEYSGSEGSKHCQWSDATKSELASHEPELLTPLWNFGPNTERIFPSSKVPVPLIVPSRTLSGSFCNLARSPLAPAARTASRAGTNCAMGHEQIRPQPTPIPLCRPLSPGHQKHMVPYPTCATSRRGLGDAILTRS
jgi:hypothetical protein